MSDRTPVVVIGGAGFLGSHVADALSDRGYQVTVFDRVASPHLRDDQRMLCGDILNDDALDDALAGTELVFNFAGIADIEECARQPLETVRVNILGHTQVLEAIRRAGTCTRYMFASTAYVYSRSGSFYRVSKQASELLIEAYSEQFGLRYTVLRYGSLYGPRSGNGNSIHRYLEHALDTNHIDYAGSGEEVREPIHVRDAARLTVEVLADDYVDTHVVLTGPQTFKYKDLLAMIAEILPGEVEISYRENARPTHYRMTPYSFKPRHAVKLLANPFVDLGEGILELLHLIQEERDRNAG